MLDRSNPSQIFKAAYRSLTRPAIALALAVLLVAAAPLSGALAATEVGGAEVVVNQVTGTVEGGTRTLETNAPVYQDEVIVTGSAGATEIDFLDGSILTLGESSQIEFTDLVFDPDPALATMVLTATVGIFSFVTGELDSGAYIIITPTATIGVRGTVFTVVVALNGATTISVVSGTVVVTSITGATITIGAGFTGAVSATGAVAAPVATTATAAAGAAGGGAAGTTGAAGAAAGGLGTGAAVGVGVGVAANCRRGCPGGDRRGGGDNDNHHGHDDERIAASAQVGGGAGPRPENTGRQAGFITLSR